ncbi:dormancy-associated protein homolog 3 [Magnolia sinica]|uniref:dormancy-associated protein homolog 3 n=1 Tax=Magnolia sinica TaxID=86752 RepID=UPI00265AC979|nr:dormancy-associated protein homolog 3 [Magnolia sinica]
MGLLDKLWDDTVAGPRPENGLSKLRKYNTFGGRTSAAKESDGGSGRSYGEDLSDDAVRVTRSIMIVKAAGNPSPGNGSPPSSPAGSTPPVSPFSGGGRDPNRFRRKSTSDAFARESGSRIPSPPHDV